MKTIMKLAQIYLSMHLVNVKNGSHKVIKAARHVDTITRELYDTDFEDHMMHIMNIPCVDKYKDSVFDFIKLDTLQERMDGKDTIAHEFALYIPGLFEKKEADTAMYTSKKTEGCCATIYQYEEI